MVVDEQKLKLLENPENFVDQEKTNEIFSFESRLQNFWNEFKPICQPFMPYFLLFIYVAFGATFLYAMESLYELPDDVQKEIKLPPHGCLRKHSFWAFVIYAISLCTTVGKR
jgi:hypothetical protein